MRELICPRLCRYFKPDKPEEVGCGGVLWLEARPRLRDAVAALPPQPGRGLYGLAEDDPRLLAICRACPYRADGCDFRDPGVPPAHCEPCGGLKAVAGLLAAGRIAEV